MKTLFWLLLQKQSDLGLHCLHMAFVRNIGVRNFGTFTVIRKIYIWTTCLSWVLQTYITFKIKLTYSYFKSKYQGWNPSMNRNGNLWWWLFVLRFYSPVMSSGVMSSAISLPNQTFTGQASPLSGQLVLSTFFCQKLTTALLESRKEETARRKYFMINLHERMLPTQQESNQLPDHQGPVVQSVVSLTSSLRVISLTVLADSIYNILIFFAEKMWIAFALQLLTFFQQKKFSIFAYHSM